MYNKPKISKGIKRSLREKHPVTALLFLIFPLALFLFFSCSNFDNPIGPVVEESAYNSVNNAPNFLTNMSFSLGKHGTRHGRPPGEGELWKTESRIIDHKKGGKVGGRRTNNIRVIIPPGALHKNTRISVSVPRKSDYLFAEFGPSYKFKKLVTIEISYANADLRGVNEDNLSIWYIDKSGSWAKVVSVVDKKRKVIIAWVDHFSRYGLSDD